MSIDDIDDDVVAAMGQHGFKPIGPRSEVTPGSYYRRFGEPEKTRAVYLNALEVASNSTPECRAKLCKSRAAAVAGHE
jgi:hypothetical protein